MNSSIIQVPVSLGELWDKYTILKLKQSNISDAEKSKHIQNELDYIEVLCKKYPIDNSLYIQLLEINTALWNIEDKIREKEKLSIFDNDFISIARSVYKTNDKRSEIKYKINTMYNSLLCEVKEY